MEAFPVELQQKVLVALPDIKSLCSLVHASPVYHRAYLGAREAIFTQVTLNEIAGKDVHLVHPEYQHISLPCVWEVRLCQRSELEERLGSKAEFEDAVLYVSAGLVVRRCVVKEGIQEYYHQVQKALLYRSSGNSLIKLEIRHCLALLTIESLGIWWVSYS